MIQLQEADRAAILDYIAAEPEMNLFIYGDIEAYGVNGGPVKVWALPEADAPHGWGCILLQYFNSYCLYAAAPGYDAAAVADFLAERGFGNLSGEAEQLRPLAERFPEKTLKPTYMSRCNAVASGCTPAQPDNVHLRRLTPADVDEEQALMRQIAEFASSYATPEACEESRRSRLAGMETGAMSFGVYAAGQLVAAASTTAANSQSAMIVSVATRPGCRGHGYASAAVAALCRANFAEGRHFLCLFYDNPAAGRIYRRIGFHELGRYAMLR